MGNWWFGIRIETAMAIACTSPAGGSQTKDVPEGTLYRTMCNKGVAVKDANRLDAARFAMTSDRQRAYQQYVGSVRRAPAAPPARTRKPAGHKKR
jgi:nicotinamide mononucleotide (NMN) deamidase PncC